MSANFQANVAEWLERLELHQYIDLFRVNGYDCGDDIKNIKELRDSDLEAMGITKRGTTILIFYLYISKFIVTPYLNHIAKIIYLLKECSLI